MTIERFLIVDNTDANVLFFQMLLKDFEVPEPMVSPTGDDAMNIVENKHPQFIIACWELNGMPGTVFIQKARAKKKRKYIPCIIYSKRMSEEDVRLTKELGFQHILSMPFNKQQATEMIKEIVDHENNLDPIEKQLRSMESYLVEGQPVESLKLMSSNLLQPGPFQVRALTCSAEIFLQLGKLDKAEANLDQALAQDPDYAKAKQLKAKLFSKLGKHDEAIEMLLSLSKASPKNITTKVNLGNAYVSADRMDEAKDVFSSILEIDPDNQDGKDGLGTVAFQEGNLSLAQQLLAETENGTELARVFNSLAISHVSKGEFDDAIEVYKNAMNILADKGRMHLLQYNLGLAFKKKGDFSAALEQFSNSYIADPTFEKAYVGAARLVTEMKKKGISYEKAVVKALKVARKDFKESA